MVALTNIDSPLQWMENVVEFHSIFYHFSTKGVRIFGRLLACSFSQNIARSLNNILYKL